MGISRHQSAYAGYFTSDIMQTKGNQIKRSYFFGSFGLKYYDQAVSWNDPSFRHTAHSGLWECAPTCLLNALSSSADPLTMCRLPDIKDTVGDDASRWYVSSRRDPVAKMTLLAFITTLAFYAHLLNG